MTCGRLFIHSLLVVLCAEPAFSATVARLVTTTGVIESVAVARITPSTCRFLASEAEAASRPDEADADPTGPSPRAAGRRLRVIDLPTEDLCRWGIAAPRPVGPQAVLVDDAGPDRLRVAGRLEAFDGQSLLLGGGDLGPVRLPARLVDRWVATASDASRPIEEARPTRSGPLLLLVNGDVVAPASLAIAAGVASLRLAPPAQGERLPPGSPADSLTPADGAPIDFSLERVSAVLPAARTAVPADSGRSGGSILVVLADGSRIPIVGLSVEPSPAVDGAVDDVAGGIVGGIPPHRTATLVPAWAGEDGSSDRQRLVCDADAITAVEFHPPPSAEGEPETSP
jgi:hypothetical protein